MICDNQTNKVYLAQGLRAYHPFVVELIQKLHANDIEFGWIPRTERSEHIWARDYMPIQLEKDLFLQYQYDPDYLKGYPNYIPKYRKICTEMGLNCITTDIVLDGGNVIKCGDKIIMTDKILQENPRYQPNELIDVLENMFFAQIVFIPWDIFEIYGHADGMVRHIGGNRVLMNNYINFDRSFRDRLRSALSPYFEVTELDYPAVRKSPLSWAFLNFLQVKDCIFVPWVPISEHHDAQSQLMDAYPDYKIIFVDGAEDLIREGGALNCISWNILADEPEKPLEEAL